MRATLVLVSALMSLLSVPAFAQESNASAREPRCLAGNIVFSPGIGINTGSGVSLCVAGSGWTAGKADTPIAGCLLDGKLSSIGAVVGMRNVADKLLQCDVTGRWIIIDSAAKS